MDTTGLKPPHHLSFEGNIAENWKQFKQLFEIFMIASGYKEKTSEVRAAIFLNIVGEEAIEKFNTFDLSDAERKDAEKVMKAMEDYCMPKSNESVDRHIFFNRKQNPGESFDEFLTSVKKLSSTCNFGDLKDSLIRDRIVSGIFDKNLKDRLLREDNLTLEKCIKMCKTSELAEHQIKTMNPENKIDAVKNKGFVYNKNASKFNKSKEYDNSRFYGNKKPNKSTNSKPSNTTNVFCGRCGKSHFNFSCPAYGKTCIRCKKQNHFAKMCKSANKRNINSLDLEEEFKNCAVSSNNEFVLGTVDNYAMKNADWYEKLKVNIYKYLYVKLDTGAQCNVLPYYKLKQLKLRDENIEQSGAYLTNYNGSKLNVIGKINLKCETSKGLKSVIEFQVVDCDHNTPAILGLPTLESLNLVKKVNAVNAEKTTGIISEYEDVFSGLGVLKEYSYDIKLKPNAVGQIDPCRKVPLRLLKPLKDELDRMESLGVIRKINEPTEFVNSLVIVPKKDGSLRICLDPQYLNENILREHYYFPTLDEISSKMANAKVFSTLDANKAFWQIQLTNKSSKLTTFNTPFGRYCFLRLPYGINSAPEIFHRSFSELFSDIEGVAVYIDDLIIWGKTKEEHDNRLKKILDRAREKNIRFNLGKCKIGLKEVKYLGHIFSKDGLKPDDDKIQAVLKMKSPTNVKELETFLGMITYISKFIPNASQATTILRDLLKRNTIWNWNANHEEAFEKLKQMLINKPVLQYFDVDSPITLSVDASKDGLGAVLLQNNLPVAYASKALTETQKRYAQIEKETLAIVFGCTKFHQYIFGKSFTIETDHKPLEAIFKKSLDKCPARLQRMRLRLQPYDFCLKYRPGKELLLADALSRSFMEDAYDSFEGDIEVHVDVILQNIPMSNNKMKTFQIETEKDEEMKILKKYITDGWPDSKHMISELAKPYFHFKEELSVANGLILKNTRVVVPKSLRKDMLERIHYSHLGIEKCKNRAREILFWPNMNKEIEDLILNCSTCLRFQKSNPKEPLMPKEVPFGPWEVLGTDLFYFQGRDFLIVIDYFSKFVEIAELKELSSLAVIKLLKSFFARFGIPKIVYSDNGPQYSKMYKDFAKRWNFKAETSSPRFPQSNGMVERHLQTVKHMLNKAEYEGRDPFLTLLEYRNTPIAHNLPSPAELMFGHKINGLLPRKEDFFADEKYKDDKHDQVRQKLLARQEKQKKYYDYNAKPLRKVEENDIVFVDDNYTTRKGQPKQPAIVLGKAERPRSYNLLKEDGSVVQRNRRHLLRGSKDINFRVKKEIPGSNSETQSNSDEVPGDNFVIQDPPSKTIPVSQSPEMQCNDSKIYTRSGRLVKKPSYLKDYF